MIICDIDNTAIPAGADAFSPRLRQDLQKAIAKGIRVLIDTGRHYTFLQPSLFADLPMEYIVTINGACLTDRSGRVLQKTPMSEDIMNRITALCDQYQIGLGFKFTDTIVTYANYEKFVDGYIAKGSPLIKKIINDDASRSHHLKYGLPLGTFLIGTSEIVVPFVKSIPELTFAWSHHRGFDVFLHSVTKATGAEPVLKAYGLNWENCIAFGDAGNDTPFIRQAGIGVAMANSNDDVKQAADLIAPPCQEDGVAQVLEDLQIV